MRVYGQSFTMRRRVLNTVWALAVNAVFWIVIPYYLGVFLIGRVPDSALTVPTFVYEFGVLFIALEMGAAFFRGKATGVPFVSAVALLTVVYLWYATNGGDLQVVTSGITVALGFRLLLYVIVLPSIWGAVRAPLSYLVWRRGASPSSGETLGGGRYPDPPAEGSEPRVLAEPPEHRFRDDQEGPGMAVGHVVER